MVAYEAKMWVDAFLAIDCHLGGHVIYDWTAPAVKLCSWEDLSAKVIVNVGDQILWPRPLIRLATESPVCVGKLCWLPAMLTIAAGGTDRIFPSWVNLPGPCVILPSRCVQTCEGGARNWIVNFWRDRNATIYISDWNGLKGSSLEVLQLRVMMRATIKTRADKCHAGRGVK